MVGNRTRKHPLPSAKWILPSHWQHCFGSTQRGRPDASSLRGTGDRSRRGMLTGQREWGLHAFRRFRTETLWRARVPEDLIGLWLGHAPHSVTDLYAGGLQNDRAWRREWCDRVGLGFSMGLIGAIPGATVDLKKAA
jgi:hypothetical protein